MLCVVLILKPRKLRKTSLVHHKHTPISARDMAVGYDKVFEFAPQFGLYQLYLFVCAYTAAGTIYGPFLTASVFFQVFIFSVAIKEHQVTYKL